MRPLIILASPVWKIAPPTTNRPTIMITTLFEKPESASSGVSMPKAISSMSAHRATTSERILPTAKKAAVTARIIRVINIGELRIKS